MGQPSGQYWYFKLPSGKRIKLDEGVYPQDSDETWRYLKAFVATNYPDDARELGVNPDDISKDPLTQTLNNVVESVGGLANSAQSLGRAVTGDTSNTPLVGQGLVDWAQGREGLDSIRERRDESGLFGIGSPGEAFGYVTRSAAPTAAAAGATVATGGLGALPALLVGGGVEAATSAGDQYNTQLQLIESEYQRDPAAFRRLPVFQKYAAMANGDEAEAIRRMKLDAGRGAAVMAAGANMLGSMALGPAAEKVLGPTLGGLITKVDDKLPLSKDGIAKAVGPVNLLGKAAGMAGTEGLEEAIQSGGEQLATNIFSQPLAPDSNIWDGVGQAAGVGGLTGAMGGGLMGTALAANTGVKRAQLSQLMKSQDAQVSSDDSLIRRNEENVAKTRAAQERAAKIAGDKALSELNAPARQPIAGLLPHIPGTPTATFDRPEIPDTAQANATRKAIPQNMTATATVTTGKGKAKKTETSEVNVRKHFDNTVGRAQTKLAKARTTYEEAVRAAEEIRNKVNKKDADRQPLHQRRQAKADEAVAKARDALAGVVNEYGSAVAAWNEFAGNTKPSFTEDKSGKALTKQETDAILSGVMPESVQQAPANPESIPTIGKIGRVESVNPFNPQASSLGNPSPYPKTFLDRNAPPEQPYTAAPSWTEDNTPEGVQGPFLKEPAPNQVTPEARPLRTEQQTIPGDYDLDGNLTEDLTTNLVERGPEPTPVDPQSQRGLPSRRTRRYQDLNKAEREDFDLSDDVWYEARQTTDPVTAAALQPAPGTPAGQRVNPPGRGWRIFKVKEDLDGNQIVQPVSQEFASREESEQWVSRNRPGKGRNLLPTTPTGEQLAERKALRESIVRTGAEVKARQQVLDDMVKRAESALDAELERVGLKGRLRGVVEKTGSTENFGRFGLLARMFKNPITGEKEIISVVGEIAVNSAVINPSMSDQEITEAIKDVFHHELTHALVRGGFITPQEYKSLENIVRKRKAAAAPGQKPSGLTYFQQAQLRYVQGPMATALQRGEEFTPPPMALVVEEAIAELIRNEGRGDVNIPIAPESKNLLTRLFNFIKAMARAFNNADLRALHNLARDIADGTVAKRILGEIGFDTSMPRDPLGRNLGAAEADMKLIIPLKPGDERDGFVDPITGTKYGAFKARFKMRPEDIATRIPNSWEDRTVASMDYSAHPTAGGSSAYITTTRPLLVGAVLDLSDMAAINPDLTAKIAMTPMFRPAVDMGGASAAAITNQNGYRRNAVNGKASDALLIDPMKPDLLENIIHEVTHVIQARDTGLNSTGMSNKFDPDSGPGAGIAVQRGSSLEKAISDTANLIAAAASAEQAAAVSNKTFYSPMEEIHAAVQAEIAPDIENIVLQSLFDTTRRNAKNLRSQLLTGAPEDAAMRNAQSSVANDVSMGRSVMGARMQKMYRELVDRYGQSYAHFIATDINNTAARELFGWFSKVRQTERMVTRLPGDLGENSYWSQVLGGTMRSLARGFAFDVYQSSRGERAASFSETPDNITTRDADQFVGSPTPSTINKASTEITPDMAAASFPDMGLDDTQVVDLEKRVGIPAMLPDEVNANTSVTLIDKLNVRRLHTADMKFVSRKQEIDYNAKMIGAPVQDIVLAAVDNYGRMAGIAEDLKETFPKTWRDLRPHTMSGYLSKMRSVFRTFANGPEAEFKNIADTFGLTPGTISEFIDLAKRDLTKTNPNSVRAIARQVFQDGITDPKKMRAEIQIRLLPILSSGEMPSQNSLEVTVSQVRKEFGASNDKRNTATTPEQREKIYELRMGGMSPLEIAMQMGLSRDAVQGAVYNFRQKGEKFPPVPRGGIRTTSANMSFAAMTEAWNNHREATTRALERYNRVQDDNFIKGYTAIHRVLARVGVKDPSNFIRLNLDSAIGLAELVSEVKSRGGSISTQTDPYLQEDLFRSKAKLEAEELDQQLFQPMFQAAVDLGLTEQDLQPLIDASPLAKEWFDSQRARGVKNVNYMAAGLYLMAKHAPERNRFVRSRQRQPSALRESVEELHSGIEDAEALEISRFIEQAAGHEAVSRLMLARDNITQKITDVRLDGGLISQEMYDEEMESPTFRHYVPMRGFAAESAEDGLTNLTVRTGKRGTIRGREDPRIRGRNELPNDPILNMGLMMRQAVVRKHKNKVLNSIYDLVAGNQELLNGADNREFVAEIRDRARKDDPAFLTGKRDGKEFFIELGPNFLNISRHMNPSNFQPGFVDHLAQAAEIVTPVMRFLTGMLTRHNPAFILSNLPRDIGTGVLNLDAYAPGMQGEYLSAIPMASKEIIQSVMTKSYNSEWGRVVQDYIKDGGDQDLFLDQDPSRLAQDFVNRIEEITGSPNTQTGLINGAKKSINKLADLVGSMNNAAELVSRVVAYRLIRDRMMDEGASEEAARERAVQVGRNLTVNFNKTGALGKGINSLYMFWNASVGGTSQIIKAAAMSPKLRGIIAGIAVFGALWPTVCRALMGDEYDKIPQWVKDRNLIIPNMLDPTKPVLIPTPYGYSWFMTLGQTVNEAAYRAADPTYGVQGAIGWAGLRAMDSFMNNWSPVGASEDVRTLLAPTLADPIIELSMNKDFTGNPIMPMEGQHDYDRASQKYWGNTNPIFVSAADILSRLSGGEGRREGLVEISPNTLEYLTEYALGGVGRMFNQVAVTATGQAQGPTDIPFVRTFVGDTAGQRVASLNYGDMLDRVKRVELEIKDRAKAGDTAGVADLSKRFTYERSMIPIFAAAEKKISRLNTAKSAIEDRARYNPKGITEFERKRVTQIEDEKRKIKASAIAKAEQLRKQ